MRKNKSKNLKKNINSIINLLSSTKKPLDLAGTEQDLTKVKEDLKDTIESLEKANKAGVVVNAVLAATSAFIFLKILGVNK